MNTLKNSLTITIVILLFSLTSYSQKHNFSPWIIIKDKPLLGYVKPIIESGSGNHISLFVSPEKYEKKEWDNFIQTCHKGGINTVYMTIFGDEKSFNTPDARKKTVDEWIIKAKEYGFDGVDMDIEHLSPAVKEEHIIFVKYAAERLHKEGLKLAMAVGFYPPMVKEPLIWWYDPATIGTYCDHVRVMLYDEYWAGGKMSPKLADNPGAYGMGPTCSYPFAVEAMDFWMKFVPLEKLIINIPAYSNIYYLNPKYSEGVKDAYSSGGQCYFHQKPQDMDESKPIHKYWSWINRIWVYIYSSDIDGRSKVFYATDIDSTNHLLDLIEEKGITSVGMWYYKGEYNDRQWQEVDKAVLNWAMSKKHK